jgi:hypothetical protein
MTGKLDWRKPAWAKKVAAGQRQLGNTGCSSELSGKEEAALQTWWDSKLPRPLRSRPSSPAKKKEKKTATKKKRSRSTHAERLAKWKAKRKQQQRATKGRSNWPVEEAKS